MEFRFLSDAREVSSQRRSYELIDTTDSSIGYVIKVERRSVRSALRAKGVRKFSFQREGRKEAVFLVTHEFTGTDDTGVILYTSAPHISSMITRWD